MIRVLHGTNEFSISERVASIKEAVNAADPSGGNFTLIEASEFDAAEVLPLILTAPFFGGQNVTVIRGLLSKVDRGDIPSGESWNNFVEILKKPLPISELIFTESVALRKNGRGLSLAPVAEVESFVPLRRNELNRWILDRFKKLGGGCRPGVAERLALFCGGDLRLLNGEVKKLIIYADGRHVESDDVEKLTPNTSVANIFAAVDAILERKPSVAIRMLYSLLQAGETFSSILNLLARQNRLIILVSELLRENVPVSEMGDRLGVRQSFVIDKTVKQARRCNRNRVTNVHRKLLEADLSIKTGRVSNENLAVEILVAELVST